MIIWLSSFPKSGNTWVRAFLANFLADAGAPVDINTLPEFALGDMRSEYYAAVAGRPIEELSEREVLALRPDVHRKLAHGSREMVFCKTHSVLAEIEGVPSITPDVTAGAVYVVRNPLDIVPSFAHHYGLSIEEGVQAVCFRGLEIEPKPGHVRQVVSDWSTHVQSWLQAPGLSPLVLRYEDLSASPEEHFGRLVEFLKLPQDDQRLRKAIRFSAFEVLAEQETTNGFLERSTNAERFFRKGGVGRYREDLSLNQVEGLVEFHRQTMEELGYVSKDGVLLV